MRRASLKTMTDAEIDKARDASKKLQRALEKAPPEEAEERLKILNWKLAEVAEMEALQTQALSTLDEEINEIGGEPKDAPEEAPEGAAAPTYRPEAQHQEQAGPISPRSPRVESKLASPLAETVTARVEKLRTEVDMPDEVLLGLANVLAEGHALDCFKSVPEGLMSQEDSQNSFVNYIEAASAFGEGRTTDDRVGYMFSVFDLDGDGYLGREDLRAVLGADASEEQVAGLAAEIGGDPIHGVTVEALIQYVKLHPGVEEALVMQAGSGGGVASQLAARPLVLLVLKRAPDIEALIRSLDRFGPQAPIQEKLARVFDTLDEDGNGQLTLSEVALLSKECSGEEVEALFARLSEWIQRNGSKDSSSQFVSREDFLEFAVSSLPRVVEALTINFSSESLDLDQEFLQLQNNN